VLAAVEPHPPAAWRRGSLAHLNGGASSRLGVSPDRALVRRACTWRLIRGNEYLGPVDDDLTSLAHAARLGEPGALEAFIEASYGQVRRFCAAVAGAEMADDLAQETYVRCVRALGRFRGEASARTWVLAIARRVCADELRSRARRRRGAAFPAASQDPVVPDAAEDVAVADLLARLDPDRRAAFVLTQLLRMPYQEASLVCGCPVGTIRSRVARARDDLIAMLAEPGIPPRDRRQALGR
jgi:RNA polymerase sigma-70 factor (ECF subfamily)